MPRPLRILGWRLLHAALRFGGNQIYAARSVEDLLGCCCHQPQCWPHQRSRRNSSPGTSRPSSRSSSSRQHSSRTGRSSSSSSWQPERQQQLGQGQQQHEQYQLESLSHLFVACPSVRGAWQWFAAVWEQVQPASGLDCGDFRTLLLDDSSVWQPPKELQQLWTHLRLLMLESIWVVRGAAEGRPYSSGQVVARFRIALQQQLRRDWARTQGDIRVDSGVPMSWLRGRSPCHPAGALHSQVAASGAALHYGGGWRDSIAGTVL